MRKLTSGAVSAVITIGMLTGCSSTAGKGGDTDGKSPAPAGAAAQQSEKPKRETGKEADPTGKDEAGKKKAAEWKDGGRVGNAGAACEFPASFEVAKAWQPKGRSGEDAKLMAAWLGHKSFRGACEIDAKPAGMIGYIRVWVAQQDDMSPRGAMEAFMAEEKHVTEKEFTDIKAGEFPAVEVAYKVKSPLLDEPNEEHAFAVTTPKGTTVVHLGGFDSAEHREMLPAYELAKKTLAPAS
ncbi:lipoprotein [Streptomyces sp. NPDC008001]|uniref:lipoprotein n=1 Tax=Streptomyces sp. NPDC008001 TaxID=3364804 RepID=UPI0036F131E5